jgi:PadR family transcriptional regulator AphA
VGNRPPRKLYELTPAGRAALDAWLAEPVGRIREIRLEFLLKLYFLHEAEPAAERALVDRQIEVCEQYQARLARTSASQVGFPRLVALSKRSAATATLDWLRTYAAALDARPREASDESRRPA